MTSRTNRRLGCRNQGDTSEARPSDLEQRRQLAVQRYLDGAPIAVICQEMGCSKSWLYKWRDRYQAGAPRPARPNCLQLSKRKSSISSRLQYQPVPAQPVRRLSGRP